MNRPAHRNMDTFFLASCKHHRSESLWVDCARGDVFETGNYLGLHYIRSMHDQGPDILFREMPEAGGWSESTLIYTTSRTLSRLSSIKRCRSVLNNLLHNPFHVRSLHVSLTSRCDG